MLIFSHCPNDAIDGCRGCPVDQFHLGIKSPDCSAVLVPKRDILYVNCQDGLHVWQSVGGANAGCGRDCACSVPVNECTVCRDSDYGKNAAADEVRAECRKDMESMKLSQRLQDLRAYCIASLTGEICNRCGATLDTYAAQCTAELTDPCPGFMAIDAARQRFDETYSGEKP